MSGKTVFVLRQVPGSWFVDGRDRRYCWHHILWLSPNISDCLPIQVTVSQYKDVVAVIHSLVSISCGLIGHWKSSHSFVIEIFHMHFLALNIFITSAWWMKMAWAFAKFMLTHCSLVTTYDHKDLGGHWLMQWLGAWRHQAITWTNADYHQWHSWRRHYLNKIWRYQSV